MSSNTPSTSGEATRFGSVFREAWAIFKKAPLQLIGIYALPMIVYAVLLGLNFYFSFNNPGLFGVFLPIFILLSVAVQYIGFGGTFRAVHLVDHSQLSFVDAYKVALQKFWTAVALYFRVLFYTYLWLAFIILVFYGGFVAYLNLSGNQDGASPIIGLILALLLIVTFVVAIIRSLDVVFSFAILMSEEKITSKEALQKSVQLAQNRRGRIFGNGILLALVFLPAFLVYSGLITVLLLKNFAPNSPELIMTQNIVLLPLHILAGCFGLIFNYTFMKKMREEKGM